MSPIARLSDPDFFAEEDNLIGHLASELLRGRLALVLGAGVSMNFGLPSWDSLIERLEKTHGIAPAAELSLEERAETIQQCLGDWRAFARVCRRELYEVSGFDPSMSSLVGNKLLVALGALLIASHKGKATALTLNFDDVLENYLRQHGLLVHSVAEFPSLNSRADVQIIHPHGLLPLSSEGVPGPILFSQRDFDNTTGRPTNFRRQAVLDVIQKHTCIFVGVSGRDGNLRSAIADAQKVHAGRAPARWGVRFCRADDPRNAHWLDRGVHPIVVDDYAQIPDWLFKICRSAADLLKNPFGLT